MLVGGLQSSRMVSGCQVDGWRSTGVANGGWSVIVGGQSAAVAGEQSVVTGGQSAVAHGRLAVVARWLTSNGGLIKGRG